MSQHRLVPGAGTLHGTFSHSYEPALEIDPGDTVSFSTLEAGWGVGRFGSQAERTISPHRDPNRDVGHALTGPVAVRGAEPGMTLRVTVESVRPERWGWTGAGGVTTEPNERLGVTDGDEYFLEWTLDPDRWVGVSERGHHVELRPFLGIMGLPPAEEGHHSSGPPRYTGGNIDCKDLVAGSQLFLPIAVPGALFSAGDGHARQGDGEAAGPALECGMEAVELTFDLLDGQVTGMPYAKTDTSWITFGFDESLDEAMYQALEGALVLMEHHFGLPRREALTLSSLYLDLRVTQIPNVVKGVHAVFPVDLVDLVRG